ncbi:MAG TPA: amino acid-binding protein [Anaeromyxobacteraceae bacterium]|nr:amino acid-binding protein [Anaeromyxobacteraceae bacterium]
MAVDQISVFLQNETGGVADVVDVLARAGVDIRALSLADESDFGILRLIVNDTDRAVAAFREAGFPVRRTPVVAVEIPDRPGGLAKTLDALRGVAVEYMYAFVRKSGEQAIVVFRFDDPEKAVATLARSGSRILGVEDIQKL